MSADNKIIERSNYNREKSVNSKYRAHKMQSTGNILSIVLGVILMACMIRVMSGTGNLPTFSSLLAVLTEVPTVQIPFLSTVITNLGDWGIFNFLRDFFQTILSVLDVFIFLINGFINIMLYVVYFMRWIFIG